MDRDTSCNKDKLTVTSLYYPTKVSSYLYKPVTTVSRFKICTMKCITHSQPSRKVCSYFSIRFFDDGTTT